MYLRPPGDGDCICGGKSEGRRGQDHDRRQPRGLRRGGGLSHPARRPRPAVQRDGRARAAEGPRRQHVHLPAGRRRRSRRPRCRPRSTRSRWCTSTPDLAGATVELPRMESSEQRLREVLQPAPRALRADRARLPALAGAAVGERARRRRPRARPGTGRVPRARGPRAVPRHPRPDPARAEPAARGGGHAADDVRQPHATCAGRRATSCAATFRGWSCAPSYRATCASAKRPATGAP